MSIEIRKAQRVKSKLRIGLAGPSGSGKTMSSLLMAKGLGGKICMIDTERGSGDLYSDLLDYDIITLSPPYAPKNYVEAINAAEDAGYDVIIIDSLSHAWADEGGLLDQADKAGARDRFRIWAKLTPQHRSLVNGMLNSGAHIIATVRSKQSYEMEKDTSTGKASVKKLGLAPIQRDGMEYEFTVFMDIEQNHVAVVSKDRTSMFKDEAFTIDEKIGKRLMDWLEGGAVDVNGQKADIYRRLKNLDIGMPIDKDDLRSFIPYAIKKLTDVDVKDEKNLEKATEALKELSKKNLSVEKLEEIINNEDHGDIDKKDKGGGGSVVSPKAEGERDSGEK